MPVKINLKRVRKEKPLKTPRYITSRTEVLEGKRGIGLESDSREFELRGVVKEIEEKRRKFEETVERIRRTKGPELADAYRKKVERHYIKLAPHMYSEEAAPDLEQFLSDYRNETGKEKAKVAVISAGGTFGMTEKDSSIFEGMKSLVPIGHPRMPGHWGAPGYKGLEYEYHTFGKGGIDSGEMSYKTQTAALAERIAELSNREDIDGIVVLHGTDTIPDTTEMLEYMLKNLKKRVVVTGSTKPITESPEASKHLAAATVLALDRRAPIGVMGCFVGKGTKRPSRRRYGATSAKYGQWRAVAYTGKNMRKVLKPESPRIFEHDTTIRLGWVDMRNGLNTEGKSEGFDFDSYYVKPDESKKTTVEKDCFTGKTDFYRAAPQKQGPAVLGIKGHLVRGAGHGTINFRQLAKITFLTRVLGRPVVIRPHTGTNVDVRYEATQKPLMAGAILARSLITKSSELRLDYLLAHQKEINRFARRNNLNRSRLFRALMCAGATDPKGEEHAYRIMEIPYIKEDLLRYRDINTAMEIATHYLRDYERGVGRGEIQSIRRRTTVGRMLWEDYKRKREWKTGKTHRRKK